ncbi:MAG TPA: DUF4157 domain-containing protein [Bacillota bacterium]|nr:DUF4157 domain-containing protein [Bacillota bacterium]
MIYDHSRHDSPYVSVNSLINRRPKNDASSAPLQAESKIPEGATAASPAQKTAAVSLNQPSTLIQPKVNPTGMPDSLKTGLENYSGMDMSDVRVQYNSPKPADVGALAYTQGTDIYIAPGQEEHLPHEAWHVVQQAQGRVRPTRQLKGFAVNDESGLEQEASEMGDKIQKTNGTDGMQLQRELKNAVMEPVRRRENHPGMTDSLKSGLEGWAGMDISEVKAGYHSKRPVELEALVFNSIYKPIQMVKECPNSNCKFINDDEDKFCADCGTQLSSPSSIIAPPYTSSAQSGGKSADSSSTVRTGEGKIEEKKEKKKADAKETQQALDTLLGPGANKAIEDKIKARQKCDYDVNVVYKCAQTLSNTPLTKENVNALLLKMIEKIGKTENFQRVSTIFQDMAKLKFPFEQINNFLEEMVKTKQALTEFDQNFERLKTKPRGNPEDLTVILLHPEYMLVLDLVDQSQITLHRLLLLYDKARHDWNQMEAKAVAKVTNEELRSTTQVIKEYGKDSKTLNDLWGAFNLLGNINHKILSKFLKNSLQYCKINDLANWLHCFAGFHRGAPPGGFQTQSVVVKIQGVDRTIMIDDWIIDHVQRRHTFEHFHFTADIINRASKSTLKYPPVTTDSICSDIKSVISNEDCKKRASLIGNEFQVGAYQVRLNSDGQGHYVIRQFYIATNVRLGEEIPKEVLQAIANNFSEFKY